ncbi:hypothetical protein [Haloparvum sedimenti]|uniref:hypothetical protein n=1 Tax=Haloparvum sedimenti TaxID=1678448 RepID=UPI00071E87B8|nr:hypothetical protein [Haloparvum sedimenti]
MSDDPEEPEEPEEPTEQPDEEEDERPEIDEDERADVSDLDFSDLADDAEDEAGATADGTEDEAGEDAAEEDEQDAESDAGGGGGAPASGDGETWGDTYVELLSVLLIEVADATSEDEPGMSADDVASLATQAPVQLDQSVNRLAAEMGTTEDLPPGQAVAISSALLAVIVLGRESDIPQQAVSKMQEARSA